MGTQLHKHSKCQMEQVNKFTEAVTKMTSSHNANKLAARSIADPENSDNSDFGADDEVNDKPNRVTIHETECSLYNEADLAAFFLSHLETSSFSVARILSLPLCLSLSLYLSLSLSVCLSVSVCLCLSGCLCLSLCLSLSTLMKKSQQAYYNRYFEKKKMKKY